MTELRECPFCGGEVQLHAHAASVRCKNKGCRVKPHVTAATDEAAISAWNRRADDWQPIETAPRDGTRVIVCAGKWVGVAYWNTNPQLWEGDDLACWTVFEPDDYFYAVHLRGHDYPTAWRPLPKGPGG